MPQRRQAAFARRLSRLDLIGRRKGTAALLRQVVVAIVALALIILLRRLIDALAAGSLPFATMFPILLLATLLGRWQAGLIAWVGGTLYVALMVLPHDGGAPVPQNPVMVAGLGALFTLLVVVLAEWARSQAAALLAEREARIAERDMLLQEVDHRLKNNLAMLAGLLALQVRETDDDAAREVLARAGARLQSLAKVYDTLRYEPGTVTVLDAAVLVRGLCDSLGHALGLDDSIVLECEAEAILVTRDRASALALLINEVVTNAAKHAFADRDRGRIRMELARGPDGGAMLAIADNGRGIDQASNHDGRGRKLIDALAEMASGELSVSSGRSGTRYELWLRHLP
jgi:two-component sensor histidine kinase